MRKKIILWSFEQSQKIYMQFVKRKAWNITNKQLLTYPKGTFGNELGEFLEKNNFELIPKGESHDAYHLLTGYGTEVEDEIALQFVCIGNGKKSFYSLCAVLAGIIVLPEYMNYYLRSYNLGRNCNTFHHFNYKNLLNHSLQELREVVFNKQELTAIN